MRMKCRAIHHLWWYYYLIETKQDKRKMTTFTTFTKRLAARISSFRGSEKVREAAEGIAYVINQEDELCEESGFNGSGLVHLCYVNNSRIPKKRQALEAWIDTAINNLNGYK